ncbi:MAG TPA: hypothetical protein PK370_00610 [Candidatus Woesebacteria bacterium]|nr:hypothetical protein [Candidatus Woesebacteria bacterium]HPJ17177.1 hypothetical protein [Candidatus Woesebacteria bacterium]
MKYLKFLPLIGLLVGMYLVWNQKLSQKGDWIVASLNDQGIEIVSVSLEKKFVSKLVIKGETKVWVPGGYGWYSVDKIKALLEQEKKINLKDKILWFNLGILPDNWVNNVEDWRKKIWWQENRMVKIEEEITDLSAGNRGTIGELVMRDMSRSHKFEGIKMSIYNTSNSSGLASIIANNMERLGVLVVDVANKKEDLGDKNCLIKIKNKNNLNNLIKKVVDECVMEEVNLKEGEIEIYFGDKYAEMINYQSYNY